MNNSLELKPLVVFTCMLSLLFSPMLFADNGERADLEKRFKAYKKELKKIPSRHTKHVPKDYLRLTFPFVPTKNSKISSRMRGNIERSIERNKNFYAEISEFYSTWGKHKKKDVEKDVKDHEAFSMLEMAAEHAHCTDSNCFVYAVSIDRLSRSEIAEYISTNDSGIHLRSFRTVSASVRLPADYKIGDEKPAPKYWRYVLGLELPKTI